jgi:hypothetical protein
MNVVPVSLHVGDKVLKAAWQQDSVVSDSMRGRGIGRELINRSAAGFDMILAKGTSDAMYKLRKACGFQDVANSNYLVKVLSPRRFGPSAKHKAYGSVLAAMSLLKRRPQRASVATRASTQFGPEFDQFRDPMSPSEVRLVKCSRYLNWRYVGCPGRDYRIVETMGRHSSKGAAVVTTRQTAWIVDLLCDYSDTDVLVSLIRASVEACRGAGAASVHTFATSKRVRECLRREGFIEVPHTPRFTYRPARAELDPTQLATYDWAFCHGDGDIELYD